MPTFDFYNLVRRVISAALTTLWSPAAIMLGIVASLAVVFSQFLGLFDFSDFNIQLPSLGTDSTGLKTCFLYCVAWDKLGPLVVAFWSWVLDIAEFICTFLTALAAAIVAWGVAKVARRQIQDYMG